MHKEVRTAARIAIAVCALCLAGATLPAADSQPAGGGLKGPLITDQDLLAALDLDKPGMESVKKASAVGDVPAAKAAYLEYCRTVKAAKWRIDPSARPTTSAAKDDPQGDRVCRHLFAMPWGDDTKPYFVGEKIDWSFNPNKPTDPAYTREWTYIAMNRMYDWNHLGLAYWKTLDEKYAREWVAQMEDWVLENPVPMDAPYGATLNWRTLEAGLRMGEIWPDAYFRFLMSPAFTPEAHATFVKSVLEHGRRLQRGVLKADHGGNWVTMECNGLATAGILFPELKDSAGFVKTAFGRMGKELSAQVYPDGGQVELSCMYHQTAMDNFAALARTATLNKVPVPEDYLSRLKPMYVWGMRLADQSGVLPPVNDETSPMPIRRTSRDAYQMWGDGEFLFAATGGKEGNAPPTSSFLPYSGYAAMRGGWAADDLYLFFKGGPVGTGHWHEDMLTLYLRCFGKTLLTEAGGYAYDQSKWRAYVLGTTAHNTITVDGKQQQRGRNGAAAAMKPCPARWRSSMMLDYAAATYDAGYMEAKYVPKAYFPLEYVGPRENSVKHTRHVLFLKPYCVLAVDMLDGNGTHRFDAYFHLNFPDAGLDDRTLQVHTSGVAGAQLALFPLETSSLTARKAQGQEDPPLGWVMWQKRPIPTIVYTKQTAAPATFATLIYPYKDANRPDVSAKDLGLAVTDGWASQLQTPREWAVILVQRRQTPREVEMNTDLAGKVSTDAATLVIRKPLEAAGQTTQADAPAWCFLDQVKTFTCEGIALKADAPVSLLLVRKAEALLLCNLGDAPATVKIERPFAVTATLLPGKWVQAAAAETRDVPQPNPPF